MRKMDKNKNNGFTLSELLITMVITSIILLVFLMNFENLHRMVSAEHGRMSIAIDARQAARHFERIRYAEPGSIVINEDGDEISMNILNGILDHHRVFNDGGRLEYIYDGDNQVLKERIYENKDDEDPVAEVLISQNISQFNAELKEKNGNDVVEIDFTLESRDGTGDLINAMDISRGYRLLADAD